MRHVFLRISVVTVSGFFAFALILILLDQWPVWRQSQENSDIWHVFALGGSTTYGDPFDSDPNFTDLALRHLGLSDDSDRRLHLLAAPGLNLAQNLLKLKHALLFRPPRKAVLVVYTGVNECFRRGETHPIYKYGIYQLPLFYHLMNIFQQLTGWNLLEEVNSIGAFEAQYHEVFRIARRLGYPVVTIKPAGNMHDYEPDIWSPVSETQVNELLRGPSENVLNQKSDFEAQGNGNFLQFIYGKVLQSEGHHDQAKQAFQLAADYRCSYVPSEEKRQIVDRVSREHGVTPIDAAKAISAASPTGFLDQSAYYDAHHPRLEGLYQVSVELAQSFSTIFDRKPLMVPFSKVVEESFREKKRNYILFTRALWYVANMLKDSTSYPYRRAFLAGQYLSRYSPDSPKKIQLKRYLEIIIELHKGRCADAQKMLSSFTKKARRWNNIFELESQTERMLDSAIYYGRRCEWSDSSIRDLQNLSALFQFP